MSHTLTLLQYKRALTFWMQSVFMLKPHHKSQMTKCGGKNYFLPLKFLASIYRNAISQVVYKERERLFEVKYDPLLNEVCVFSVKMVRLQM